MLDTKTIGWLAGLLEGEGCFFLAPKTISPVITLSMTDKDVVQRVADLWDRPVWTHRSDKYYPGAKMIYRTELYGLHAAGWLMTIFSFLGERRQQKVKSILAAWRSREGNPRVIFDGKCLRHPDAELFQIPSSTTTYCRGCRQDSANKSYHKRTGSSRYYQKSIL